MPTLHASSSAATSPSELVRERAATPTSSSATTCWPRSRTSTTSWPGSRSCSRPPGVRHDRVPAPGPPRRGRPVRHDLPRALLVLLAGDPRPDLRRPRPGGGRRRRAADARRLAAGATSATRDGRRPSRRRSRRAARARAGGRLDDARGVRGVRRARRARPKRALLAFLIAWRRDGPSRGRLRRAGQGQHAAQLLRDPGRPAATTRSTATRTSTAGSRPGCASRSIRPSGCDDAARTIVLILPWNLRTRDRRPARRTLATWGAPLVVPDAPSSRPGRREPIATVAAR